MLDSGANVCITPDMDFLQAHGAVRLREQAVSVGGVYGGSEAEQSIPYEVTFMVGTRSVRLKMYFNRSFKRTIVSHDVLYEATGWLILPRPWDVVLDRDGEKVASVVRLNRLTFMAVEPASGAQTALEVCTVSALPSEREAQARLWAARLFLDGEGLREVQRTVAGLGMRTVDPAMARAADEDTIHRRSTMRAWAVPKLTSRFHRATKPGMRLICDGFGKVAAPSVVGGWHHELSMVCELTSFGFEWYCQSENQREWLLFITRTIAECAAYGHVVHFLRFDELGLIAKSADFVRGLEDRFKLVCEFAPRGHHEGVGAAEVRQDMKQRMAEADLMRSHQSQALLLLARRYAGKRINLRACRQRGVSRFQDFTGGSTPGNPNLGLGNPSQYLGS